MPNDKYLPLSPPPGAWRNGTRYEAGGRWYDVNYVRWTNGRLRPIGGWAKFTASPTPKPSRGLHTWRANNHTRWLAIGTGNQLLVHDNTDQLNITPLGFVEGRGNSAYGLGWGAGKYGEDAYGTARVASGIILEAATWSFDNFGENLIGSSTGDGRIYQWAPSQYGMAGDLAKAIPLTNAPVGVSFVFVTEERHVVALGRDGNPRNVSWSSRENANLWEATATTSAGNRDVSTPGKLMAAVKWRNETVLFTDCDVHLMRYVQAPFFYGFQQVGEDCGLIGPKAAVGVADRVAWMSTKGFWQYDGVTKPVPCDVQDYVFKDINVLQGAKITAGHNGGFGEIWWFYPSANSVENDRYVIWSYREGWWSYGKMARTAWADSGVWPHIVAGDPDGHLHQHEQGWYANGISRVGEVYAESGAIEIGRGERFTEVRQLIPDCEDPDGCVSVEFALRENPRSTPFAVAGPYTFTQANGYMDARFAARQIEMKVKATKDGDFSLGVLRADVTPGSGR